MSERAIQNQVLLAASEHGLTLFRNNVGTGWAGKAQIIKREQVVRVEPGDVVVRNARPLHAGLCKGSADLVGLRRRVLTDEDVGHQIAQFAAIEIKTASGRVAADQAHFLDFVRDAGGVSLVARGPADLGSLS